MSLRNRSRVKASVVLTRAGHLFIHNYIRSLLNNIVRPMARTLRVIIQMNMGPPICVYSELIK